MCLSYKRLKKYSTVYLALPAVLFAATHLRWYLALAAIVSIGIGLYFSWRPNEPSDTLTELKISKNRLFFLSAAILVWTWLGGLNGLFYQSADWPWRNAIYHDLVSKRWPVIYPEKGSALVYYIGFWLPPALPAKLIGLLTSNQEIAWQTAQCALWLWSSMGLLLITLTLMFITKANTPLKQWSAVMIFIFFSGMDIIGAAHAGTLERVLDPEVLHLEWWTHDGKQYSSITTCLYWVFNQAIVPWLATACFMLEKDARNYVFLGAACLICGPFPFVGLVVCMIIRWLADVIIDLYSHRLPFRFKSAFSLPNLLILALFLPLLGIFFLSNISVSATAPQASGQSLMAGIKSYVTTGLIAFLALDAGFLCALVWPRRFKDPLFYAVAASLIIIPYFHIGTSEDFCLRASIPALFMLMCWCAEYLINELPLFKTHQFWKKCILSGLILALLVGACTPLMEIYRGIYNVIDQQTIRLSQDTIGSIGLLEHADNFTTSNYFDTVFFKYLAR